MDRNGCRICCLAVASLTGNDQLCGKIGENLQDAVGKSFKSIQAFGLGGTEAFYDYCPMAFNNEGAYWLSDQAAIRNPYFGDAMLTCGTVKETLK